MFLAVVIVMIIVLVVIDKWYKDENFERIPGPKGYFFIGNAFSFIMDPVKLFYTLLEMANTYKDIFKVKIGPKKFVVVMNPEDIETIISGSSNSSKGFIYSFLEPWLKKGLVLNSGAQWQQRRKILTPAFHFKILQHFTEIVEEKAKNLVTRLEGEVDKPETDIMSYVTDFTLSSICETAMGVRLDFYTSDFGKRYKNGIHTLAEIIVQRLQRVWLYPDPIFALTPSGRTTKKMFDLLKSFRAAIVNKRREANNYEEMIADATQSDDTRIYDDTRGKIRLAMLDLLLQAEKNGIIHAEGIAEEVDTFIFAGHDTTARALQFTFMLLANNPDWQDKIVEECKAIFGETERRATLADLSQMKLLDCCIKESLRLYPPVYIISRKIDNDLKLKNHILPAGTDCMISISDVMRRPDQFVEPNAFRPERFLKEPTWHPYAYIPFSAGPRNCIGQKFAMMELKLVLSAVLRCYRILPVTKPEDLIFIMDFLLRTTNTIYVKFEKRT